MTIELGVKNEVKDAFSGIGFLYTRQMLSRKLLLQLHSAGLISQRRLFGSTTKYTG